MPSLVGSDSALLAFLPFPALLFDIETLFVAESNKYFCKESNIQLIKLLTKYDYRFFSSDELRGISSHLKLKNQYSIHKLADSTNAIRTFEISFNLLPDSNYVFLYLNELSTLPAGNGLFYSESKKQLLQNLVDNEIYSASLHGIYRISSEGRFLFSNDSLVTLLKYPSVEELFQTSFSSLLFDTNDWSSYFLNWGDPEITIQEVRLKEKDGNILWCRDIHRIQFNEQGDIEYFEGIIENISQQKIAERQSENQLHQLKELIDFAGEGIGFIDADYKVVLCNSTFAGFFSLKENSLIGKNIPELLKGNTHEVLAELEINKFGLETTFEFTISDQKSGEQYYEFHSSPKFDTRNNYSGSMITIRNKTELKQSGRELALAKEKALEADRLKSTFLTNMSHEIRTPMNSILGFSSLLKRKGLTKEKRDQYLEIICSKGKHLMSVISDIIDITKIEEHQIKLSSGPCDLNKLMENLFETFQYEVVKSGHPVKLFLNSSFHQKNNSVVIDSERLIQILTNLLNNSLKFTESGYIEFGFTYVDSQTLNFYVKDTGIGVLPEMDEIIFERFRQADESNTRGFEGTGLGLSICKGLVDLMGGKIWVESDGKCGSTFNFTVPIAHYEGHPLAESGNPLHSPAGQNKKILIIEDDQASYQLLREYLEMTNCNVLHAFDGNDALHTLQESGDIDLILLDIQLPVMDGYQVARAIRQINPTIPIIAQTAHALGSDKYKCMEAGCNDFLSKPIQFDLLEKMIHVYLSGGAYVKTLPEKK